MIKLILVMVVTLTFASLAFSDDQPPTQKYLGKFDDGTVCKVSIQNTGDDYSISVYGDGFNGTSISTDYSTPVIAQCGHIKKVDKNEVSVRSWEGEDMQMWFYEVKLVYTSADLSKLDNVQFRDSDRTFKLTPVFACTSLLSKPFKNCKITGPDNN